MKKFDLNEKLAAALRNAEAYAPGEQPRGGGWVKLNTNEFPYPPSPKVIEAIMSELSGDAGSLRLYPDPQSLNLRAEIASAFGLSPENVIATNGSDDLLNIAMRAFSDGGKSVAALDPSYSLYPVLAKMCAADYAGLDFDPGLKIPYERIFSCGANIFFFTNPNAPTGAGWGTEAVERIAAGFDGIVVADEAYAPFSGGTAAKLVEKYPNLIVAGTLSKGWGLAGMRVGWGLASGQIIRALDCVRDSYNLDRLAQAAGVAALRDAAYYEKFRAKVVKTRENTAEFFRSLGWEFPESSANFIFVTPKDPSGKTGPEVAADLFEFLKARKILVRYFSSIENVNMAHRVTIGTDVQMEAYKAGVREWLAARKEQI